MLLFGKMLQFTHPHSTIPFPGCQPAPPEILRENDNTSMTEQYIIPVLKVFEGVWGNFPQKAPPAYSVLPPP